jgi:DNA-binding response OmpR family regulator
MKPNRTKGTMQEPMTSKTRVLIVDDDPVVLRIYKNGLTSRGFQVDTAADGLLGVKAMHASRPDLVVLDLMMPRLSGGDVLKVMHENPDLAKIPVIVLSNSYMQIGAGDAPLPGAKASLLKVQCTPSILSEEIRQVLAENQSPGNQTQAETVSRPNSIAASPLSKDSHPVGSKPAAAPKQTEKSSGPVPSTEEPEGDAEVVATLRAEFLASGGATCVGLLTAFQLFSSATHPRDRELRLQDLYRKIHLATSSAGLAECNRLAQMGTALEALLFRVMDDPTRLTTSCLRTMSMGVDYLQALFRQAQKGDLGDFVKGEVLIVDDDAVSNRLVGWGLTQAGLRSRSVEDPAAGLELLRDKQYDLILLDVEMPKMNGFEFYKRARALPGYKRTPVIYVTAHADFETCARSLETGISDLIEKPVNAMELAVKVTMHLLSGHAPGKR